jgi:alpha-glucosidase (family GH31 glycosyl hydrolase)
MKSIPTRRSVLGGIGAGVAQLLLHRQLNAASLLPVPGDKPSKLDFSLTAITPRVLRISIAPAVAKPPSRELGVIDNPHEISIGGDRFTDSVRWGKHGIRVEQEPLRITLTDAAQQVRQQIQFDTNSTAVRFRLGSHPVFGLGEGLMGLDRRGSKDTMHNGQGSADLRIAGSRVPIPWVLSPEGWGVFVGQPMGTFDLTGEMGVVRSPVATSTRNVYVVLGDTPAEVLQGYAELTGYPHLPPLWSLGYMQSHRTLASRDEVLGIARTFRAKKLPCDTLIYLGTGFCPSGWNTGHGSFAFNADVFPDPAEMIRQLHAEHFKVALHVVPPYDFHGKITDTGSAAQTPGDASPYWAEHMPIEKIDVDGWWPDEGDLLPEEQRLDRNAMYWDGQRQAHPDRRPFALHRNGYAGLQLYGWLWSGDIDSTWKTFAAQVTIGINMGLCGIPYWGTDTAGFIPTSELTAELYVRWFQFSAFCPLFRSHGVAWKMRLPWAWGQDALGPLEGAASLANWPAPQDLHNPQIEIICRNVLNLRYRLLRYLYSSVDQTHRSGLPLMRALWIAYPQDAKALSIVDQYLFGDQLLVSPVIEPDARQRKTYLPAGTWWDFWTNQRVNGDDEVTREVDLATIPLYVRAGAILPIGPVLQHTAEPSDEPLTLQVYPGADGQFAMYEDDGTSFRYEQGDFIRLDCTWEDASRTLRVAAADGTKLPAGKRMKVQAMDNGTIQLVTLTDRGLAVQL